MAGPTRSEEDLSLAQRAFEASGALKDLAGGLVDRAAARGLIERKADPDDGRAIRVSLTAKGRALAGRGEREVKEEVAAMTATLTDAQRRQLASLLEKVVSAGYAGRPSRQPRA